MRRTLHMWLAAAALTAGLAVDCRAGDAEDAAREVPPALERVDALLAQGRAADALVVVDGVARRHGTDPLYGWQISNRRGVVLLAAGRPGDALPLLEAAVSRSPLVPEHHRNLADALRRLGRRGRALSEYQQTVELAPADPVHRLEHAYVLLDFRMWRRAEHEFRAALDLCSCPEAERGLAESMLQQGRPAAAAVHLRRLHGARPTARNRGDLLAALQGAGADSAILELLTAVPAESLSTGEAVALVQAEGVSGGDPVRSLEFMAIRREGGVLLSAGSSPVFWGRIALNLLAADRLDEALEAADAAVALAPDVPAYRQNRAAVLQRLGRQAEALRELDEVRRLTTEGKE
ncbi:MAG: tetratricopeptide repeat protein [bacterium]|nr:tetratricopeptide repeat protein [bacterium]